MHKIDGLENVSGGKASFQNTRTSTIGWIDVYVSYLQEQ